MLIDVGGQELLWYFLGDMALIPALGNSTVVDATGEKYAYVGRVWFPDRGTHSIRRCNFRFGSGLVKAGGSALTVSLQDVTSSGTIGVPDEVQAQTVAIANANAAFAGSTPIVTNDLSADRLCTHGDLIAFVIEYDAAGRLGADTFNLSLVSTSGSRTFLQTNALHKTGGVWSLVSSVSPNIAFECSDGTRGGLAGGLHLRTTATHTFQSGTNPDEWGLGFISPFDFMMDGVLIPLSAAAAANFEVILSDDAGVIFTRTYNGNTLNGTSNRPGYFPFNGEYLIKKNKQYYVSVEALNANNIICTSVEAYDATYTTLYPGGPNFQTVSRNNKGAWAFSNVRHFCAGLSISRIHASNLPVTNRFKGGIRRRR